MVQQGHKSSIHNFFTSAVSVIHDQKWGNWTVTAGEGCDLKSNIKEKVTERNNARYIIMSCIAYVFLNIFHSPLGSFIWLSFPMENIIHPSILFIHQSMQDIKPQESKFVSTVTAVRADQISTIPLHFPTANMQNPRSLSSAEVHVFAQVIIRQHKDKHLARRAPTPMSAHDIATTNRDGLGHCYGNTHCCCCWCTSNL